jgi:hypothetical protein
VKSKFIPLPEHPATVKCAVTKCGKVRPIAEMLHIGNGIFACKEHRASTRMKGIPRQNDVLKAGTIVPKNDMSTPCTHDENVGKKTYKIDLIIQGTIEEV